MGNIKQEENQDKKPQAGGDGGQQHRRKGRQGRNRWNNSTGGGGGGSNLLAKFLTRNKDLPDTAVFDNTGQVDAANFQRALKAMSNYLHTTYSAEVGDAILKM